MSDPDALDLIDAEENPWSGFAEGKVACPECRTEVAVPVQARFHHDVEGQRIETRPDMTELWAHAWTHGATGGAR